MVPKVEDLLAKADVAVRLGISNVIRVLLYRASIRLNISPACRLRASLIPGDFFHHDGKGRERPHPSTPAMRAFGWFPVALSGRPHDWFENIFTRQSFAERGEDWWRIDDFNSGIGDIKGVWEMSRFGWVPILALSTAKGNESSCETLNRWLSDWCRQNPPYKGLNWKCGQETSIRILNLALGALVLREVESPAEPLVAFLECSLRRVFATRSYALAQNNNHGTSEAAGLFIGGEWLRVAGSRDAEKFAGAGRRQLERLSRKLIDSNGGFTQYSLNYHRLLLDTLLIVELWRRALDLPRFSREFYRRCFSAAEWLRNFVDESSRDVPNVGCNDGAHLLEFLNPDYRNFHFSVQLAYVVFADRLAFELTDDVVSALSVLELAMPSEKAPPRASFLDREGGYACLRRRDTAAFVRFPRFKYRPGHADALHVDLWVRGRNVLLDGGSYSYNCDAQTESYFLGVESHNTIQFDDREQMLRVSRFLFAAWPTSSADERIEEADGQVRFAAAYRDYRGANHHRTVALSDRGLLVSDRCDGFEKKAVLRWRLGLSGWTLRRDNREVHAAGPDGFAIRVVSSVPIDRAALVPGYSSRYYSKMEEIQVLEIEVSQQGSIVTELSW